MLSIPINVSASGDSVLVAAVPGFKIRVFSYSLMANGAVSATFKDSAGNSLAGPFPFAAAGQSIAEAQGLHTPERSGLFDTALGASLKINLGGNVQVGGRLSYDLYSN